VAQPSFRGICFLLQKLQLQSSFLSTGKIGTSFGLSFNQLLLKQEQKKWKEYHHCVSKLKINFPHLNLTQAWQPLLMVFFLIP
jgi:hypothetical protein